MSDLLERCAKAAYAVENGYDSAQAEKNWETAHPFYKERFFKQARAVLAVGKAEMLERLRAQVEEQLAAAKVSMARADNPGDMTFHHGEKVAFEDILRLIDDEAEEAFRDE